METAEDRAFKAELIVLIPFMRAFALGLCRSHAAADDIVQDALIKAWSHRKSFTLGTNMRAWAFFIVRTTYYSELRRTWRTTELDPEIANNTLEAVTSDTAGLELDEVRRALNLLPTTQREALVLVGAGGLAYEEAAKICEVSIGTIKSRVSRGRLMLTKLVHAGHSPKDNHAVAEAMPLILCDLEALQNRAYK